MKKYNIIIPFVLSMMLIVLASNYLVQFQFNYLNLENILTWGAFTYPIAFLVTDLANRVYGLNFAKRIIIIGFFWGVVVSSFFFIKSNRFNLIKNCDWFRFSVFISPND